MAKGTSAEELLREADIAMYRAKWDGKNRYAVFETGMQDTIQSAWSSRWTCATPSEGEFFLVYQPTIDAQRYEPHRRGGADPLAAPGARGGQPDEFIPLAEETGLIAEIGRWVLNKPAPGRRVARGRVWIGMGVNVSARQLDSDQLIADIRRRSPTAALSRER